MKNCYLILLLILIGCNDKQEKNIHLDTKRSAFFDPLSLGSSGIDANLNITADFSECGECGGHHENLKIYVKPNDRKNYYLDYLKTQINCDQRDDKGRNIEKIIVQKTIQLNDSDQKSIIDYIKRMVNSKVEERFPGHAGESFSVINSDSTLVIKVYDHNAKNVKSYNQLLKELKFE